MEQSTPFEHEIFDANASVSSILLTDRDLDASELGGSVSWTLPPDASRVADYYMYLTMDEVVILAISNSNSNSN